MFVATAGDCRLQNALERQLKFSTNITTTLTFDATKQVTPLAFTVPGRTGLAKPICARGPLQTAGAKPALNHLKLGAEVLQVINVGECTDSLALEDLTQRKPPTTSLSLQRKPPGICGSVGEIRSALLGHKPGPDEGV